MFKKNVIPTDILKMLFQDIIFGAIPKQKFVKQCADFEKEKAPIFFLELRAYGTNASYVWVGAIKKDKKLCKKFLKYLHTHPPALPIPGEFENVTKIAQGIAEGRCNDE